jgi:putative ABC transport system permease protein
MLALTLKGLWANRLRYALTSLAVVLGVAFMAGTMVLTDTMETTFDGVVAAANDGTDVIVRRADAVDGELTAARGRIEAGVVEQVAAVDGVETARGSIQGFAQLVKADGSVSETDGLGVTIGANWIDDEGLNPFELSSGRAPDADDEVVLDENTAEDEGWSLGSTVTFLSKAGPTDLRLVGTASYGAIGGVPGSSLVATNDTTAQQLFAEPGRYDNVLVAAAPGVTAAELVDRIGSSPVAASGAGLEALSGEQDTTDKQADFKDDVAFFNQFLMAFAYVALFVGVFIIYNTFSIVVAQRMKDIAMLRAIGARRGQVLRAIVLESIVVGLVSAAAGLVAGVGLSFALRALLTTVGLDIPSDSLVISAATIATAFVVGVTVSVLSSVVPAVRAGKVRPVAALRESAIDTSGLSLRRVAAGLALTGAGIVAFAAGLAASGQDALPLIGLGAMTVIVGVFVLGPVLVRPAIRVLGAPTALLGVTGSYARQNALRNPKRTAATASALMIGVALVGFITILAASTKSSISAAVDTSFRSDYVVDSGSWDQGFATSIEDDLRTVPEVATLSPERVTQADVDGSTTDVVALDTAVIDELYDLEISGGSITDVHGDGVALDAGKAADDGLALGDTVPVTFADGQAVPMTVNALFDSRNIGGDAKWVVGLDTFADHVADQFDRQLFVAVDDGVPAADSRAALEAALADWPNADIQDQAEFKEGITAEIDQMLNLIYGLLALAVVIALIGIANTLALSVHERTREVGLLRAVGMQRRQLRRAVRWEAVLIAVLGATLGAVLAVGGAWGIVAALDEEGVTQLTLPVAQLAVILGMAGVAGVLAATGPARRAARLDVLDAIASE